MDWDLLEQRKVRPPFRPRVVSSCGYLVNIEINKNILNLSEKRTWRCQFRHRIYSRGAGVDASSQRYSSLHQSRWVLRIFLCEQRIWTGTKDLLLKWNELSVFCFTVGLDITFWNLIFSKINDFAQGGGSGYYLSLCAPVKVRRMISLNFLVTLQRENV